MHLLIRMFWNLFGWISRQILPLTFMFLLFDFLWALGFSQLICKYHTLLGSIFDKATRLCLSHCYQFCLFEAIKFYSPLSNHPVPTNEAPTITCNNLYLLLFSLSDSCMFDVGNVDKSLKLLRRTSRADPLKIYIE